MAKKIIDNGRTKDGGEKLLLSGYTTDYGISERLQEVLRTWSWYIGTDQINDDSEVLFRCGECKFGMNYQTDQVKLAHIVTFHGYNMNGYVRHASS